MLQEWRLTEDSWHRRAMAVCVDRRAIRAARRTGLRDLAILALLDAGLRPSEIARLTGQSIEPVPGCDLVQVHLATASPARVARVVLDGYQSRCLIAYLAEARRYRLPEPLLEGDRGPLTTVGVKHLERRYRRQLARRERRQA